MYRVTVLYLWIKMFEMQSVIFHSTNLHGLEEEKSPKPVWAHQKMAVYELFLFSYMACGDLCKMLNLFLIL
jgi:hypothetical protein